MRKFIQGEEGLKFMMKKTKVSLAREGLGMAANIKDKSMKYEGKHGIPYDYAMSWKICHKFQHKGHLA